MSARFLLFTFVLLFAAPFSAEAQVTRQSVDPHSVGATHEIHVTNDGAVVAHGVEVTQLAGRTFFAKSNFENISVRWTITTSSTTVVKKRYGGSARASDIKIGDILSIEGDFFVSSDTLGVRAKKITDWSAQEERVVFGGTVDSVEPAQYRFILKLKDGSRITVSLTPQSVILKGSLTIRAGDIIPEDKILEAAGVYDFSKKALAAERLVVYQDMSLFKPRNFEGVVKSISGATLPATVVIQSGIEELTVEVGGSATVFSKKRSPASFGRFLVGDTIRVWGARREENHNRIDAEIIRNLNL